jgi:hypothetical protein
MYKLQLKDYVLQDGVYIKETKDMTLEVSEEAVQEIFEELLEEEDIG